MSVTSPPCEKTDLLPSVEACIHCGMCLPVCPTYRVSGSETESPRGRLYLMRAYEEGRLSEPTQLTEHLDRCLGCLACQTACPSGVQYDDALMHYRDKLASSVNPISRRFRRLIFQKVLPNPAMLRPLVSLSLWFRASLFYKPSLRVLRLVAKSSNALLSQWASGWLSRMQLIPANASTRLPLEPLSQTFGENKKGRVALFIGCVMNQLFADIHQATIDVLVSQGYQVVIPTQQTCCGALAHHSGENDIARNLLSQNAQALLAHEADWVVVNAAGCGSTLAHTGHLLEEAEATVAAQGKLLSEKIIDITALLALNPLELPDTFVETTPLVVSYHAACHLHHAQSVQKQPYQLLEQLPYVTLVPFVEADTCCGSAGIYNITQPDWASAIAQSKEPALRQLCEQGVSTLLSANPGCLLQWQSLIRDYNLPLTVCHPIQLLAKAIKSS